jgi:hypothetical protein
VGEDITFRQTRLELFGDTVILRFICKDAYQARVLYEDLEQRTNTDGGFCLTLRNPKKCPSMS